jgi:hypothetical protein
MTQPRTYITHLSLNSELDLESIKERIKSNRDETNGTIGQKYKFNESIKCDTPLFFQKGQYCTTNSYPKVLDCCNGIKYKECPTPLDYLSHYAFYGVSTREYYGDSRDKIMALRHEGEFQWPKYSKHKVDHKEPLYAVPDNYDEKGDLDLFVWQDKKRSEKKITLVWVPENAFLTALNIHMYNPKKFKDLTEDYIQARTGNGGGEMLTSPNGIGVLNILAYYRVYKTLIETDTFNAPIRFSKKMFKSGYASRVTTNGNVQEIVDQTLFKLKEKFIETFKISPVAVSTTSCKEQDDGNKKPLLMAARTLQFK